MPASNLDRDLSSKNAANAGRMPALQCVDETQNHRQSFKNFMKSPFHRGAHIVGAALVLLGLAGCSASNVSSTKRELAGAILAARGFDRAGIAIRRDDAGALKRADADLQRAANSGERVAASLAELGRFIEPLASDGSVLEDLATRLTGADRQRMRAQSALKYRAALAFLPSGTRENQIIKERKLAPETLNALGYFLASRGTTRADFERAARLTRAALRGYDEVIQQLSSTDARRASLEAARAQGPQDSYAWALFKLGRFDEALKQQEQVLATLKRNAASGVEISADLPFHLGEIRRAQGNREGAIAAYQQALELVNDEELRAQIEAALTTLGVGLPEGGKII